MLRVREINILQRKEREKRRTNLPKSRAMVTRISTIDFKNACMSLTLIFSRDTVKFIRLRIQEFNRTRSNVENVEKRIGNWEEDASICKTSEPKE